MKVIDLRHVIVHGTWKKSSSITWASSNKHFRCLFGLILGPGYQLWASFFFFWRREPGTEGDQGSRNAGTCHGMWCKHRGTCRMEQRMEIILPECTNPVLCKNWYINNLVLLTYLKQPFVFVNCAIS